jgi:predicted nucleic acid-binding protein
MKKLLMLTVACVNTAFSQDVSLIEKELLRLIQEERTKAGLNEVVHLEILDRTAEIQATYLSTLYDMYQASHSHPDESLESVEKRHLSLR